MPLPETTGSPLLQTMEMSFPQHAGTAELFVLILYVSVSCLQVAITKMNELYNSTTMANSYRNLTQRQIH